MEIGQKTLVYSEIEKHPTTDNVFQTLVFPKEVKLSTAVTSSMSGEIRPVEGGGWYNYTFDLTETGLTASIEDDIGMGSVEYSSSDGITYTRTSYYYHSMDMGEPLPDGTVKFMKPSKFSVLPTQLSEFFTVTSVNFDGLYYMDEVRDGTRMITYTGEEYKLPYDIMNDIDIYSQWSKNSAIGLFMFDKVTKNLEIYDHNKFMIKDGAFYSISPSGSTAVRYLKYTYSTGEVYHEMNVPVSQTGIKIHDNFSDLVIGCIDDYNGVTFLDENKNTIGTYTNGDEHTFPFKKKIFKNSNVGLPTSANRILPGYKAYTNDGVITGTFGQNKTPEENLTIIGLAEELLHQKTPKYLFQNYSGRKMPIDLSELTFDESTNYNWMFYQSKLETVNAAALDMSHAVNIACMFQSMPNLKRLDCSGWKLDGNVLAGMNSFCNNDPALEEIIMFNVHTTCQNVHVEGMFNGCSSLRRIDCSGIIVDSISSGSYAGLDSFAQGCSSLEFLDIRGFTFNSDHLKNRDPFTNVPTDCLIVVRSDTEKNALTSKYPRMTNIKTVAEYEAS